MRVYSSVMIADPSSIVDWGNSFSALVYDWDGEIVEDHLVLYLQGCRFLRTLDECFDCFEDIRAYLVNRGVTL